MKKSFFIVLAVLLLALYAVVYHGGNVIAVLPLTAVSLLPACAAILPIMRLLDLLFPSEEDNKPESTSDKKKTKPEKIKKQLDNETDEDIFTSMFSFD